MTADDLRREIAIELELIETVLQELSTLREDVADRESTVRERTAAAAFMAQFYGGIENILKRMKEGLENIDDVYSKFKANLLNSMDRAE